jgi:putative transcriptional regulator
MSDQGYLDGQILIAMPGMEDPRFDRSVIYLCAHTDQGALGFVVNKTVENVDFDELLEQLEIPVAKSATAPPIHFGGPVETERGFILQPSDGIPSLEGDEIVSVTSDLDSLKAIALGEGPKESILVLGYAGWAPGQLEDEIQANGWLHCAPDPALVFGKDNQQKWEQALKSLGIEASMLSSDAGSA